MAAGHRFPLAAQRGHWHRRSPYRVSFSHLFATPPLDQLQYTQFGSDKERRLAHKEVAVLSSLSCPNIVNYVESFEEDDTFHIVMEYASVGSLATQIKKLRDKVGCSQVSCT
jgi:serine/threonine protein kinase